MDLKEYIARRGYDIYTFYEDSLTVRLFWKLIRRFGGTFHETSKVVNSLFGEARYIAEFGFLIRLLRSISSVQKPPSRADPFRMARAALSYAFDLFFPAMVFCADCFGAVLRSRFGGAGAAATDS